MSAAVHAYILPDEDDDFPIPIVLSRQPGNVKAGSAVGGCRSVGSRADHGSRSAVTLGFSCGDDKGRFARRGNHIMVSMHANARRPGPHGHTRWAVIAAGALIAVGAAGVTLGAAGTLPQNVGRSMVALILAGIGALAWALPERVDFLGRSRKMLGGTFFLVAILFAVLELFGVSLTR